MHTPAKVQLTSSEREYLLGLARQSMSNYASTGVEPSVDESTLSAAIRAFRGCFVTLTRNGEMRGCIGNLDGHIPLFRAVIHNACGAAFRDSRFGPVSRGEIEHLRIKISVLTEPVPLSFSSPSELLRKLRPDVDGVVLKASERSATYLPQVWEKLPDPKDFMNSLAAKAMLPVSAWRASDAVIQTYQVESFEENRPAFDLRPLLSAGPPG
jgi:AmmeMemoRadiSam system protein A